jgi:pimeloyl-ACP methyl ester carboxylesterase
MRYFFMAMIMLSMITTEIQGQAGNPTYVLVHGGWHGAWSWNKLMPVLKTNGIPAMALDLPGCGDDKMAPDDVSLRAYVDAIINTCSKIEGPVVLLGHSSGGVPVAQAAEDLGGDKVRAIVFLDAFMPSDGESVFSIVENYAVGGPPPLVTGIVFSEDKKSNRLDPAKAKDLLYHDCQLEDIAYAIARLGAQPVATQATPVRLTDQHYGRIPKYYILCTEARDFNKSALSKHVPCRKVYELPSSHSPFFSMPERLAGILKEVLGEVGR